MHPVADHELFHEYVKPLFLNGEMVLEVECGSNKGLMFLSRLCQGSKGACILHNNMFLTPNEFQYISGRETAKDWKRSIRHCGRSMKLLLTKGVLVVHSPACECLKCRPEFIKSTLAYATQLPGTMYPFGYGYNHHLHIPTASDATMLKNKHVLDGTKSIENGYPQSPVDVPSLIDSKQSCTDEKESHIKVPWREPDKVDASQNFKSPAVDPSVHSMLISDAWSNFYGSYLQVMIRRAREESLHAVGDSPMATEEAGDSTTESSSVRLTSSEDTSSINLSSSWKLLELAKSARTDTSGYPTTLKRPPIQPLDLTSEVKKSKSECNLSFSSDDLQCHDSQCARARQEVNAWTVQDVCAFVASIAQCGNYEEAFRKESIDGAVLPMLTVEHMMKRFGMKLGPSLKLRSTLAARLHSCPECLHCLHCHEVKDQRNPTPSPQDT